MRLCNSGHEEVCYDDISIRKCPVCSMMEQRDKAIKEKHDDFDAKEKAEAELKRITDQIQQVLKAG